MRTKQTDQPFEVDSIVDFMKSQFGDAVKSYWVYAEELCPACNEHPSGIIDYHGQRTVSFNGFMYREKGVLIGYLLCSKCANEVMAKSKLGYTKTSLHESIEQTLIDAYNRHMNSQDA